MESTKRIKRSEKMNPSEVKKLSEKIASFDTKTDAAEYFGFTTVTLDNICLRGSAKPSTLSVIREKLKQVA